MERLSHGRARGAQWRSLLAFWRFVHDRCEAFPVLSGLCLQLGAVTHEVIHTFDMDRLSHSVLNDDKTASFIPDLVKDTKAMRRYWIDGLALLSAARLQQEFPEAWKKSRRAGPLARREGERLVPEQYRGEYHLPLSSVSTPIEAVRATAAILGEWTRKEGVPWKGLLDL